MRKRSKEYKEMFKKHKKILRKIAKKTNPFDYCYAIQYFVACLEFMRDYYKLGENIYAMEKRDAYPVCKDEPTRLESLEETLKHFYASDDSELGYLENRREFQMFLDCVYKYIEDWWD